MIWKQNFKREDFNDPEEVESKYKKIVLQIGAYQKSISHQLRSKS